MLRESRVGACDDLRLRAHLTNRSRSSEVRIGSDLSRPVRAIPHSTTYQANFRRGTLPEADVMELNNRIKMALDQDNIFNPDAVYSGL